LTRVSRGRFWESATWGGPSDENFPEKFKSENFPFFYKDSWYCNKFAGSISQWKFITLTVQYTTLDYSSQLCLLPRTQLN
jgi:hypothetical protein